MHPTRLRRITYLFPGSSSSARGWFTTLRSLLASISNAQVLEDQILFTPLDPVGALPDTAFQLADVGFPQVVLDTTHYLDLNVGHLRLRSTAVSSRAAQPLPVQFPAPASWLSPDKLAGRLRGRVMRIDHSGINIPASVIEPSLWAELLRQVAPIAALYRCPGEEWPFVLPATEEELSRDIKEFVVGREPKFELVYDSWTQYPVVQLSLNTDLSCQELETMFPPPYGTTMPGLGELFRTVYMAHPWPQLVIRIDLYYADADIGAEWETGAWLVTDGGRIRG